MIKVEKKTGQTKEAQNKDNYSTVTIKARVASDKLVGFKSEFVGCDGKVCHVEEIALQYYRTQGWQGTVSFRKKKRKEKKRKINETK